MTTPSGASSSWWWRVLTGPTLLRIDREAYSPNRLEWVGQNLFLFLRGTRHVVTLLSPMIAYYAVTRGYVNQENGIFLAKYVAIAWVLAYATRTIGRMTRSDYAEFLKQWQKACDAGKADDDDALVRRYDFDVFHDGPVQWVAPRRSPDAFYVPKVETAANPLVKFLGFVAVHTFGRRMLYPGSLAIINTMLGEHLIRERASFVLDKRARRTFIKSDVGNIVDTIFFDRRRKPPNGDTLVICFEGNAGFYENGISVTPHGRGYSVLGWNTPGFGGSTGIPWPDDVLSSADAVMQFAQKELGFQEENIVLFAWSIGGFPASWLAANYPRIRALYLDATFDDVEPLALARMPSLVSNVVTYTIRNYFDLAVARHVAHYEGPLRLVRRLQEDILVTDMVGEEDQRRASNRANELLKSVLRTRFPDLMSDVETAVDDWLAAPPYVQQAEAAKVPIRTGGHRLGDGVTVATTALKALPKARRASVIPALCAHFLVDVDANHVTPLDPLAFELPSQHTITADHVLSALEGSHNRQW